jgi:hypothetical protein
LRTITRARLVSSASANWVSVAVFMYSPYQLLRTTNKLAQGSPGSPLTSLASIFRQKVCAVFRLLSRFPTPLLDLGCVALPNQCARLFLHRNEL